MCLYRAEIVLSREMEPEIERHEDRMSKAFVSKGKNAGLQVT